MNTKNFKTNPTTIFKLSSRTIHKIIARASLSCSICKWDKATGDIHHIVEVSEGGSNNMSNLIYVCPNCHRCIHQLGDIFKSKKELFELSMDKTFPNWLDYYNPQKTKVFKINNITFTCKKCGISIPHHKQYCSKKCSSNLTSDINWSKELLINTLKTHNGILTKCGKELGVSDNAFKKQCKKFGINPTEYKTTYKRSDTNIITI